MYAGQLPEESYRQFFIAPALWGRVGFLWLPILVFVLLILNHGKWNYRWSLVPESVAIRFFVTGLAAVLAWNYVIMDCNQYFGQWHLIDRALLAICVALVWLSPLAVVPFCVILVAFQGQFHHPHDLLPHFWTEKNLAVRMLALFSAYHALILCFGRKKWPFVFCLLLLLATHYWPSGWSKIRMGWLLHNDLSLVSFSSYANGWQSPLSHQHIVTQSQAFGHFSFLSGVFTQAAETFVIFLVWRSRERSGPSKSWREGLGMVFTRWRLPVILLMLPALHIGIWMGSGICFMTWIVVDLMLFGLVLALMRRDDRSLRFSSVQHICFVVLVLLGSRWSENTKFSWFETRACYAYRIEAIDQIGNLRSVPAQTMAPYDFAFTWTVCNYLYSEKQLNLRFGNVTNYKAANEINSLANVEELYALERVKGTVSFDPVKTEQMKSFLQAYFANLNQNPKLLWLDRFQRPCEIASSPRPNALLGSQKVSRVIVKRVTTFYDGEVYTEPRVEKIFEVDIE